MSSVSQFGLLATIDGVAPVAGNVAFTSSDSTIIITPGVGTIDFKAVGGGGGGITTIDGDSGSVTGSTVTITGGSSGAVFTGSSTTLTLSFNELNLPATTTSSLGVINIGGSPFIHAFGAVADNNTFVGYGAGNFTLTTGTAEDNTGIGHLALSSLTTGAVNTAIGNSCATSIQDGSQNVAIGHVSLVNCTSGNQNTAMGVNSLDQIVGGSNNIGIGFAAGNGQSGSESNCILIGSMGISGESNAIRIGIGNDISDPTNCFIAGIQGVPATSSSEIVIIDTNGRLGSAGAATDGQILIGATGTAPVLQTITAGTGISITNATHSITISNTGSFGWIETTGTSASMSINTGYIANNAGLVTFTLPATAALGSVIKLTGKGAGGWTIAQNASGQINFGSSSTTVGVTGSLSSTLQFDSVELVCITADNIWNVLSSVGNLTVV